MLANHYMPPSDSEGSMRKAVEWTLTTVKEGDLRQGHGRAAGMSLLAFQIRATEASPQRQGKLRQR